MAEQVDSRELRIAFSDVAHDWLEELAPRFVGRRLQGDDKTLHRLIMLSSLADEDIKLKVYVERLTGAEPWWKRFARRFIWKI